MVATFEEPIGPLADVTELLYVVSLHQASLEYREDISINAEDISLFLISRYGVECSPETVQEFILKDVAAKRRDKEAEEEDDMGPQDDSMGQDMSDFIKSKFGVTIQPEDLNSLMTEDKTAKDKKRPSKSKRSSSQGKKNEKAVASPMSKPSDEEACKMDLLELVALLWIPEFRKIGIAIDEGKEEDLEFYHFVADAMLHDLTSIGHSETPNREITPSLIRDLFLRYGETNLAKDEKLIQEMVKAATSGSGERSEKLVFDMNTLARALTHDIIQYNPAHEDIVSTCLEDVFGKDPSGSGLPGSCRPGAIQFATKPTAAPIDMVAHTYFCRVQMVCNWLFFVFTYFAYIYYEMIPTFNDCPSFRFLAGWTENQSQAGCSIAYSIVDWLIMFLLLCITGMLFVGLGSVGNDVEKIDLKLSLFSMAFLVFLTVYFPLVYGLFIEGNESLSYMRLVSLVLGIVATMARFRLLILSIKGTDEEKAAFPMTATQAEAMTKKASAYKIGMMQGNAFSVHDILTKSSAIRSHFGLALTNFSKLHPQYRTRFDGFSVFRQDLTSGRISAEDGVFFSGRLLAGHLAQAILCITILGFGYTATRFVRDNWIPEEERGNRIAANLEMIITLAADQNLVRKAVDGVLRMFSLFLIRVLYFLDNAGLLRLDCILLGSFLQGFCANAVFDDEDDGDFACSLFAIAPEELCKNMDPLLQPTTPLGKAVAYEDVAGVINTSSLVEPVAKMVSQAMSGNIASQVNHLYPRTRSMVVVPVACAAAFAIFNAVLITYQFIPSITATVLKLRTGVIPSVCDPQKRLLHAYGVNGGTYIFGAMFWGILASSLLVGGIIGFIIFISMWQVTAYLMIQAVAFTIGISVTLTLKWLVSRTRRIKFYRGFYRNDPLKANYSELVNESFNFATNMAFAIIRLVKLLLLAAFYVGRINTKFLDDSANRYLGGWLHLDIFPEYFIGDILMTEAHRHPYIERLGTMYLYKIKYGSEFATRAGCAWRLLFVTALMPWLQKYRIASRQIVNEAEPEPEPEPKKLDSSREISIKSA